MSPISKQAARTVAAFLIIALVQVYVLADAARPATATSDATASAERASMIFGKLSLPGSRSIFVNGNEAGSGTTVFSGAQIQTPEATEATVLLGSIGHLDIAPNSNLTLTFDQASVDVLVVAGDAVLSTNDGIKGTVRSPEGKVERSNNPATAVAVVGLAPAGRATRAAKTSTEEKASLIIIPIVIAAIIILTASGGGDNNDNLSPTTPNL